MRRAALVLFACAVTVLATHAQQKPSLADLKTTAESTGYKSTSTYDDVVKFMKAVDEASPIVFYTTYGTTTEGRAMPMAVVGTGLKDASPAAVKATRQAARAHPGQRPRRRSRGQGGRAGPAARVRAWGSTRTGCSRWSS